MKVKKMMATIILALILSATCIGFYDLYLYNVQVSNRYFRGSSVERRIKVVVVRIPRGAAENLHLGFEPTDISIQIGLNNTVTWKNEDDDWHTVHSNIPEFYSNLIQPGGNFTHTFETPGIYPYHCDPHPWMVGKITVSLPKATNTVTK